MLGNKDAMTAALGKKKAQSITIQVSVDDDGKLSVETPESDSDASMDAEQKELGLAPEGIAPEASEKEEASPFAMEEELGKGSMVAGGLASRMKRKPANC